MFFFFSGSWFSRVPSAGEGAEKIETHGPIATQCCSLTTEKVLTQLLDHVCQHLVLLLLSVMEEHGIRKLLFHNKMVDAAKHAKKPRLQSFPQSEVTNSLSTPQKGYGKKAVKVLDISKLHQLLHPPLKQWPAWGFPDHGSPVLHQQSLSPASL